jgi:hypothetical protein
MSETQGNDDLVEDVHETEARLAEAVEALAYKKSHAKDEVKEAVIEKKDKVVGQVKEKVADTKDDLAGAVHDKIEDVKEAVVTKVEDAKDTVASKLPGSGGAKESADEGLGPKLGAVKDAIVSKAGDIKDAVADKLPGGDKTGHSTAGASDAGSEPIGMESGPTSRADGVQAGIGDVDVIPVDEHGRPRSESAPRGTAADLRDLAGELRAEGRRGAAQLADDRAAELDQLAE